MKVKPKIRRTACAEPQTNHVLAQASRYRREGQFTFTGQVTPNAIACPSPITHRQSPVCAFTLMEVMVAAGIFFMAVFAILALVSNTLRNARGLRQIDV